MMAKLTSKVSPKDHVVIVLNCIKRPVVQKGKTGKVNLTVRQTNQNVYSSK